MSETNLALFVKKVSTDAELQQQIASLQPESREDALAATVKLSEKYGTPVTAEELSSLSALETNRGEISDSELEQVAGGLSAFHHLFRAAKVGVNLLNELDSQQTIQGRAL